MLFKFLTLPFDKKTETFDEEEVNNFLVNKKLNHYEVEFFLNEKNAYWTVFMAYEVILEKDHKNDLQFSEAENLLRDKLREWRKEQADQAGVPVYIIFANEQMNAIVRRRPASLEALKQIRGFGKKKIDRYGKEIIELVKNFYGDNHE